MEAGHAVVDMHDQLAGLEFEAHRRKALAGAAPAGHRTADATEQFVIGQHRDAEGGVLGTHRQVGIAVVQPRSKDGVEVEVHLLGTFAGPCLGQQRLEPLRLLGGKHDRHSLEQELVERSRSADERFRLAPTEVDRALRFSRGDPDPLPAFATEPMGAGHRRPESGWKLVVGGFRVAEPCRLLLQLPYFSELPLGLEIDHQRVLGKVIEERRQRRFEVGRVILHSREGRAGTQPSEVVLPLRSNISAEVIEAEGLADPRDGPRSPLSA